MKTIITIIGYAIKITLPTAFALTLMEYIDHIKLKIYTLGQEIGTNSVLGAIGHQVNNTQTAIIYFGIATSAYFILEALYRAIKANKAN